MVKWLEMLNYGVKGYWFESGVGQLATGKPSVSLAVNRYFFSNQLWKDIRQPKKADGLHLSIMSCLGQDTVIL